MQTFPTYKHLESAIDYTGNAHGYTDDQLANKFKIPVFIIELIKSNAIIAPCEVGNG